ncbi:MAG: sigma-70 family RNA polymerase sigma factor [Planctomycetia bacterium]|nr:sigma-70 family RNA polymerase sigma factor [Planctomycetia bacterium]
MLDPADQLHKDGGGMDMTSAARWGYIINSSFQDLITRVRQGDQQAASELVRRYEPEIRRTVRIRLTDPSLRAAFDSLDICQSVLASFFTRVALGQFQFDSPGQLVKLLTTMARNKLISRYRHERSRGCLSAHARKVSLDEIVDPTRGQSELCTEKDLLEVCLIRLTPDERRIAAQRGAGQTWIEIARELQSSPEALRKRFTRACDRIVGQVELTGQQ